MTTTTIIKIKDFNYQYLLSEHVIKTTLKTFQANSYQLEMNVYPGKFFSQHVMSKPSIHMAILGLKGYFMVNLARNFFESIFHNNEQITSLSFYQKCIHQNFVPFSLLWFSE